MTTQVYTSEDHQLSELYADVAKLDAQPLWEMKGILTPHPVTRAVPFHWKLEDFRPVGDRARQLVPIDRGGDRRVLALCNPGLDGQPFAVNTLWAAYQFLGAGELAPAHRHTPAALRFIVEGGGVWTLVNGDPIHMERGDLILTPSWCFHEHHNPGTDPMVWLDVLDLPIVSFLDGIFFEEGPSEEVDARVDPQSASERTYGAGAGLLPVGATAPASGHSPLLVYRWAQTDVALRNSLQDSGEAVAKIRFANPVTGADVMPTIRTEMWRVSAGQTSARERQTGGRVISVLNGTGTVVVSDQTFHVAPGDVYAVPSWHAHEVTADDELDLFISSDAPVLEALHIYREQVG
ncbi:cupin domain-containing protein [Ornithinimicrobium humiphilum]|uniref:cupin domain-containing protein n=1 Tax=Ornithinimicrobium humiphilum TaxID=125288 RepID=UPI0031DE343B